MTTLSAIAPASPATPGQAQQADKLKGAAHAFEAVFLRQMISSMRSAGLGEDLLGNDAGNQFRDMSDAKLADSMADRGTLGIADMLLKQFSGIASGTPAGVAAAPVAKTGAGN